MASQQKEKEKNLKRGTDGKERGKEERGRGEGKGKELREGGKEEGQTDRRTHLLSGISAAL